MKKKHVECWLLIAECQASSVGSGKCEVGLGNVECKVWNAIKCGMQSGVCVGCHVWSGDCGIESVVECGVLSVGVNCFV